MVLILQKEVITEDTLVFFLNYSKSKDHFMNRKEFLRHSLLGMGALYFTSFSSVLFAKNNEAKVETENLEIDNVIIGSGYGGAVAALRLAEAGHEVTILEMGLNWEKSGEKFSPMISPGKSAAWLRTKTIAPFFNIFNTKKYTGTLDRWDFSNIKIWMGRGVGGGSLVNGGMAVLPKKDYFREIFPELNTEDFYKKYFPLAEKELEVNSADENFLENCSFYKFNKVGEQEAHKAGFKTVRVPNVYDFKYMEAEYENKVPRSALAGEVIYGNNYGKKSLDKTYLKKAQETGKVHIHDLHRVESITKGLDNTYILEVIQTNTLGETTAKKKIVCKKLFLCAGTMGTLELLLKSSNDNKLILNSEVGKNWGNNGNFMTGRNFVKTFSGGTGVNHSTIPVGGIDNWNDKEHPFFTEIAPLPMGMDVATSLYLMISPVPEKGAVFFDPVSRKIDLKWSADNVALARKNAEYFIKTMNKANGGTRAHLLFNNGFGADICYHPLGGAALGKATDKIGRLLGSEHLYIIDGSLIPGTIGVNPFLTITALAEYCIEHIISEDY
ncbi:Cholesterol oxidase precursor [compost metagenome]